MPLQKQVGGYAVGIGALLALLIVVFALGFWVFGHALTDHWILAYIIGLALAILLP